jgi:phenol 2-monooxygenase
VIRLADAKRMELGHVARADGRWRVYAFADRDGSALRALCDHLERSGASALRRFTPTGADVDAVIDVRAVFQQPHRELEVSDLPPLLRPRKGRFGLIDYEKTFCAPLPVGADMYERRGIDRDRGAIVVVRPDQYVATVLPLDGHVELAAFFAGCLIEPS